jgi:hypothetical protein
MWPFWLQLLDDFLVQRKVPRQLANRIKEFLKLGAKRQLAMQETKLLDGEHMYAFFQTSYQKQNVDYTHTMW